MINKKSTWKIARIEKHSFRAKQPPLEASAVLEADRGAVRSVDVRFQAGWIPKSGMKAADCLRR